MISVWAAFSVNGRTIFVRIDGNLNKDKYIKILNQNLLTFGEKYHGGANDLIFQQDFCGTHIPKAVRYFLDVKGIELLPWAAQSSDMNPIENACAILKRNLRQQSTHPTSKDLLFFRFVRYGIPYQALILSNSLHQCLLEL